MIYYFRVKRKSLIPMLIELIVLVEVVILIFGRYFLFNNKFKVDVKNKNRLGKRYYDK